ncbi:hypothetical protein [Streptomyces sp. NPDC005953]|uniref:hypothetical protein n=1 Tax=Streptomyces sp. NPDC005953 TaxID=3156719 RepID=UPI0033DCA772
MTEHAPGFYRYTNAGITLDICPGLAEGTDGQTTPVVSVAIGSIGVRIPPEEADALIAAIRTAAGQTERHTPATASVCICGHPEHQHFEGACQTCDCGDFLVPEAAREMIAHLHRAVLAKQDGRRATTLRERADFLEGVLRNTADPSSDPRYWSAIHDVIRGLRQEADGVQPPTEGEAELTATLVINRSDSYCDGCRKPTLPQRTHHTDISGWTPVPGGGCGARFTATRSDYRDITPDELKDVRPDLPAAAPAAPEEPSR